MDGGVPGPGLQQSCDAEVAEGQTESSSPRLALGFLAGETLHDLDVEPDAGKAGVLWLGAPGDGHPCRAKFIGRAGVGRRL
jgi:hypothetical protein